MSPDAPESDGPAAPREGPRRKKRRFGFSIWFMLLVIGAALLLQNLFDTREEMNYSEFKALLEDVEQRGRIEQIDVSDERIRALIRPEGEDGAEAVEHEIIRVNPDEKLVDLLRDSGVSHGGITEGTGEIRGR